MKWVYRILAVVGVFLLLGLGVLVWIGIQMQRNPGAFGGGPWMHPTPVEATPSVPEIPSYEDREGRTPKPRFLHPHGYQDSAFDLKIAAPEPDAEIWYTVDGSIPLPDERHGGPNGRQLEGPLRIAETARITAVAVLPGKKASIPVTASYLFLDDILKQSRRQAIEDGWPADSVNHKNLDYGMDSRVVSNYSKAEWKESFKQIPTLSLVTAQGNLTDAGYGIYTNPTGRGKGWERYTSLELIYPDGREGFQVGAGLRIRGGFTRNAFIVKHSFRLFFRKQYGAGKLRYPLFGDEGTDRFDKIDLRTAQNYAWAREHHRGFGKHNTFVREVFCRDTQRDMGGDYTRSRYYHLFLNGQYWGIYMTEERPEAAFGASYFDGEREDFDTLKTSNFLGGYNLKATDGDTEAWRELWEAARELSREPTDALYARISGVHPETGVSMGEPALVEIDNLIIYMLVGFYAGNTDGPISEFLGNDRSNNWFAIRNRNGREGFRFFIHDGEHTLGAPQGGRDRTGPFRSWSQDQFEFSNPQWLHQDLVAHAAYRKRFGDLAKTFLEDGGPLTTEPAVKRFRSRADQITVAIRAHAARWGDAVRPQNPYRVADWEERIEWVIERFLRGREVELIRQLREDGLYPSE